MFISASHNFSQCPELDAFWRKDETRYRYAQEGEAGYFCNCYNWSGIVLSVVGIQACIDGDTKAKEKKPKCLGQSMDSHLDKDQGCLLKAVGEKSFEHELVRTFEHWDENQGLCWKF